MIKQGWWPQKDGHRRKKEKDLNASQVFQIKTLVWLYSAWLRLLFAQWC